MSLLQTDDFEHENFSRTADHWTNGFHTAIQLPGGLVVLSCVSNAQLT